ncbi:winged helix-turn-helix transcriptional regulator [Streptomyces sp. NPDC057702]|uniref:winged helix-turn-helix transcriptional regulator n=1 Tax=unclassified Streptomyces TaxID=2593676 RepID=UPI0036C4CA58
MATKRSYHDACGVAHALDLVGERWALLVVRELLLGPKRYSDLRTDLPGISTNVLSHRLDELEEAGVVHRRTLPPPASSRVYELTEWGLELEPIIRDLGRWGARSTTQQRDAQISPTAFALSLRTNFDPGAADGVQAAYELRLGQHSFHATVADGVFEIDRGSAAAPDATIEGPPGALASVIYGGRDLADATRASDLAIEGNLTAVERFLSLFPLPEPVAAPDREQPSRHTNHS